MHIEYLFFALYVTLCFWAFPKIPFIAKSALSKIEVRGLLAFRMLGGIMSAFYFDQVYLGADYSAINAEGVFQKQLLLSDPASFFGDFSNDIRTYGLGNVFDSSYSFWAYLKFNLLYKFVALLSLLTGGNFYLNSVVFCSLVFFGHIAFYRIYSNMYPRSKKPALVTCFLLPSLFLYTSCVQKEGFVFLAAGITSFAVYRFLNEKKVSMKQVLAFVAGTVVIFLFRNYVVVALMPAVIIAVLCSILPYKKRVIVICGYAVFSTLFFLGRFIHPSLNLPSAVVKRKEEFAAVGIGSTDIPMQELHPTVESFIRNLPQALNHAVLRPYPWEFLNPVVLLTALEILLYQLVFLLFLFFRDKKERISNSFNVYGFAFFLNMMLIIGYSIPNVGAIVRYRSIFWIFLLCPLACCIDWKKLKMLKEDIPEKLRAN